jgi:4-hydroxythreonine-4-phosphate dehydrogenase
MKKLAITMGDPWGVGPEIILKALNSPEVRNNCVPVVIGDPGVMEATLTLLNLSMKLRIIQSPEEARHKINTVELIDLGIGTTSSAYSSDVSELRRIRALRRVAGGDEKEGRGRISRGETLPENKASAQGGKACVRYIKKAVEFVLNKWVDGIVTAPISKEALKMAGFTWSGHTEMLADLTNTKDYAMMLAGGPLRVILVTIHTALKNVPDLITKKRIVQTLHLAKKACDMLGINNPRIAVAGLNPHAGEAGIFGDEEIKKITPAIRSVVREGIPISGPYPPDTIFHKAYEGHIDIVVCMYHDQGLIPLKMIAFDRGVNITVGLPFVRTSPDHGTAYDIAWRGIANPSSMIEAIKLAAKLKV